MDWERLIIWVMRFDGAVKENNEDKLKTARRWYKTAMACGAELDVEKLQAVAREVMNGA